MSMETGTATSSADLLDKLNAFLLKGHALSPSYTGTGNGTITGIIGSATSVLETITVTLTAATTFSVSGSITGAMGAGTVGTPFSHARAAFTVNAGGTAWVNGDTIVFVMTPPWVQQRGVAGSEYIWKAPGNDNTASIYVGALRFNDTGAGNYDNWRLGGFTGYDGPSTFTTQPGTVGATLGPVLTLWSGSIPYWFMANGRRVVIIAKVSSSYEGAYLGFITPYASPGQWPYPLAVGGSMAWGAEPALTSANWRFSYSGAEHQVYPRSQAATGGGTSGQLRVRKPDGTWRGFGRAYNSNEMGALWPSSGSVMTDLRPNLDGTYPLLPIVLTEDTGAVVNVFGELDGVRATTGHNNAAENTVAEGRTTWLVVQNAVATTKMDYFCIRMD